jgi:hypothetical protein
MVRGDQHGAFFGGQALKKDELQKLRVILFLFFSKVEQTHQFVYTVQTDLRKILQLVLA